MQVIKILHHLGYLVLAAQGFYLLSGAAQALGIIPAEVFAVQRKAIDDAVTGPYRFLYLFTLALSLLLLFLERHDWQQWSYLCLLLLTLLLIADLVFAVRFSLPANQVFQEYARGIPADISHWQAVWLFWIKVRGVLISLGYLLLLLRLYLRAL